MNLKNTRSGAYAALLLVSLTLGGAALVSAQDRHRDDRGHDQDNHRDWDGRRDHRDRDDQWERRKHRHSGELLSNYPDYSSWRISGGLYPVARYDDDRDSHDAYRRQRASFFGHTTVNFGGHTFARVIVNRNGRQYYAFKFGG